MDPSILLVLAAVVWLAGYAAAVRWWPYVACRKCSGASKLRSPSGKAWRICTRCRGTGRRLRLGRRVLNAFSTSARQAADR